MTVSFTFVYSKFLVLQDCGDSSDESNCADYKCPPEMWPCPNSGHCIPEQKLCDGKNDCPAGEDEKSCCKLNSFNIKKFFLAHNLCSSLGCQAGCRPSPHGGLCTCPQGYQLDQHLKRTCSGRFLRENRYSHLLRHK
jgi:hypothetical protein